MSSQHQRAAIPPHEEQTLQDCIINLQSRIADHRTRHLQLLSAIASAKIENRALNPHERQQLRGAQDLYIEVSNALMQEGQTLMEKLVESMERLNGQVEEILGRT